MSKRCYYEVLGVARTASGEELKKSFRRMAMKCHPDRCPDDPAAQDKFKEAKEAYEILSDQRKRTLYDQHGHAAFEHGGGNGAGGGFNGDVGDIFGDNPQLPNPASAYVCAPSITDPSVAPEGSENLFVLVPIPADPDLGPADSGRMKEFGDAVIQQIADWSGIDDLAERIVVDHRVGPYEFVDIHHAWQGTALGPAHTLRQSAFFRGRVKSRRVDGLYYAGGYTAPGVGLPMCLISAENVIKTLRGDTSGGPMATPLQPR